MQTVCRVQHDICSNITVDATRITFLFRSRYKLQIKPIDLDASKGFWVDIHVFFYPAHRANNGLVG